MKATFDVLLLFIGISCVATMFSLHYRVRKYLDVSLLGYISSAPMLVNLLVGDDPGLLLFVVGCLCACLIIGILSFVTHRFVLDPLRVLPPIFPVIGSLAVLLVLIKGLSLLDQNFDSHFGLTSTFNVMEEGPIQVIELITVLLYIGILLGTLLLSRSFVGLRFRAYICDMDVARSYGISKTFVAGVLAIFTGVCAVIFGVLVNPSLVDNAGDWPDYALVSLSVVLLMYKKPAFIVSVVSFVLAVILTLLTSHLETVSQVYGDILSVFGIDTDHPIGASFVVSVLPFMIAVGFSWILGSRERSNV